MKCLANIRSIQLRPKGDPPEPIAILALEFKPGDTDLAEIRALLRGTVRLTIEHIQPGLPFPPETT